MFESRSSRPTESFYNTGENTGESTASSTCVQHGLQSTLNHITSNFSGASFDFRSYTDPSNSSNNIIMVYYKYHFNPRRLCTTRRSCRCYDCRGCRT